HQTFQSLSFGNPEPPTVSHVFIACPRAGSPLLKEENMRKFALATAAVAALAFSAPAFTAPAFAQDVKVKIKSGEGRHHGEGMRHREVSKKVIIKHGDRGHHYGWRNHHEG